MIPILIRAHPRFCADWGSKQWDQSFKSSGMRYEVPVQIITPKPGLFRVMPWGELRHDSYGWKPLDLMGCDAQRQERGWACDRCRGSGWIPGLRTFENELGQNICPQCAGTTRFIPQKYIVALPNEPIAHRG